MGLEFAKVTKYILREGDENVVELFYRKPMF